jgi:hypothetical protein
MRIGTPPRANGGPQQNGRRKTAGGAPICFSKGYKTHFSLTTFSGVAQWERDGLITHRSLDRNQAPLTEPFGSLFDSAGNPTPSKLLFADSLITAPDPAFTRILASQHSGTTTNKMEKAYFVSHHFALAAATGQFDLGRQPNAIRRGGKAGMR